MDISGNALLTRRVFDDVSGVAGKVDTRHELIPVGGYFEHLVAAYEAPGIQ